MLYFNLATRTKQFLYSMQSVGVLKIKNVWLNLNRFGIEFPKMQKYTF